MELTELPSMTVVFKPVALLLASATASLTVTCESGNVVVDLA
jgi:hypothetical protein